MSCRAFWLKQTLEKSFLKSATPMFQPVTLTVSSMMTKFRLANHLLLITYLYYSHLTVAHLSQYKVVTMYITVPMENTSFLNRKKGIASTGDPVLALLAFTLISACLSLLIASCDNPTGAHETASKTISNSIIGIIETHDTTVLYCLASWCRASQTDFTRNLVPLILQANNQNKLFVIVTFGEVEQTKEIENLCNNAKIIRLSSGGSLLDKIKVNLLCRKVSTDYKMVDYFPVSLLFNKNCKILNLNTDKNAIGKYQSIYYFL